MGAGFFTTGCSSLEFSKGAMGGEGGRGQVFSSFWAEESPCRGEGRAKSRGKMERAHLTGTS